MDEPLSVGLNLMYLLESSGGSGTYAAELVRGILAVEPGTEIVAFTGRGAPESAVSSDWGRRIRWVRFPVDFGGTSAREKALSMAYQWASLPLRGRRHGLDVLHGPANIIPPLAPGLPTVVTLLDVIWIHYPQAMDRRATLAMKVVAPLSARRADRVIAISEAARADIVQTLGLDPARVDVTHLGVSDGPRARPTPEAELRRRLDLGAGPLLLCVAQKREHKNLTGLIRALAEARPRDVRLVLPGAHTPHEEDLRRLAGELGVADRVRMPGWLADEDLEGLYAAASCFVLPSFIEGFGLPILEAMKRGVPVACSGTSALGEVAGDAALLFDPHRPEEIAAAVTRLLEDRGFAGELVARGAERCRSFTWEATARATLATYRRAIASAGRRR